MNDKHRIFGSITKVDDNDDGTITVHGVASSEARDSQGECVTKGAMTDAIPDYFAHGTGALRAMHQPIAAGFVSKAEVNAAGETEISATVVDPVEIIKVKTGTYKGFSIGGKKLPGGYDAKTKTITKMRLTEISLVDRPANPEATITMWKGDDMDLEPSASVEVTEAGAADVDKLADIINAGKISTARLVEIAEAEVAKVMAGEKTASQASADATQTASDEAVAQIAKAAAEEIAKAEPTNTPAASVDPAATEVAKVAAGEIAKVEVSDEIKKGMYAVADLANVLNSIQWLASSAIREAQSEGDGSKVPASIVAWLKTGAGILSAMAAEEAAEMIAGLTAMFPPEIDVVQMAEKAGEIRKALESAEDGAFFSVAKEHAPELNINMSMVFEAVKKGETIEQAKASLIDEIVKAGARNSKADMAKLQAMHDNAVSLGADCSMGKAHGSDDIKKVADLEGEIAKLTSEKGDLQKLCDKMAAEPTVAKGSLRVVHKKDDVIPDPDAKKAQADEPIKKSDGSIDEEATAEAMIKKIHQSGGTPMTLRR